MSDPLLTKTKAAEAIEDASDTLVEAFRPPPNTLFLHAKQMEVYKHPARFKVVVAGRRWGKCLRSGTMIEMADGSRRPIETIEPGDTYLRYRFFDCGDAGTVKMHPECYEAMQEEAKQEGGFMEWTPGEHERPITADDRPSVRSITELG